MARNFKRDVRANLLLVLTVLVIGGVALYLVNLSLNEMEERDLAAHRQVGILSTLQHRFMAIYTGPEVYGVAHGGQGMATVSGNTAYHATATPHVGGAAYSRQAPQGATGASYGGGAVLPTQSSATMHTYGGGGSQAGAASGQSGHNSASVSYSGGGYATAPAMPARKLSTGATTYAVPAPVAEEEPVVAAAGPRRAGSYGDYEPGDDCTYNGETHPIGSQKTEGGKVYEWTDHGWRYVSDVTEVNEPIGDTPWLWMLLLLGGYAAFAATRRKAA